MKSKQWVQNTEQINVKCYEAKFNKYVTFIIMYLLELRPLFLLHDLTCHCVFVLSSEKGLC